MTLVFPNEDTLRLALSSGLVPPAVSLAPAHCTRTPEGTIRITPATELDPEIVATGRGFGVTVVADSADGERITHWLQSLPLRRTSQAPALTDKTPILFELPATDAASLVCEMLRLGNDRQSFRLLGMSSN